MEDFKRLLIPLDFSEGSREALRRGVEIARASGAELVLQTVIEQREVNTLAYMFRGDDLNKHLVHRFDSALASAIEEAGGADLTYRKVVTLGTPFLEVLKVGLRVGADLIVISSRSSGGLNDIFPLANTTYKVLRQSPCSVYSVPLPEVPATEPDASARPILVPVDFSDYSRRALHRAVTLARQSKARLHLLNVIEGSRDDSLREVYHESSSGTPDAATPPGPSSFDHFLADFDLDGLDTTTQVADRNASQAIVRVAAEIKADLIVIGSHGRGNLLQNLLLGGTVYQVVRRAGCGVMVVKPKSAGFVLS